MKIHKISGKHWQADIAPDLGGNVACLKYDAHPVFVPLMSEEQLKINPYLQGAPILLPANRTKDGKFSFGGKEYSLPINEPYTGAHLHGLVHLQKFEVLSCKDSEITLRYINDGKIYPFPFELKICYGMKEDSFEQRYMVTNIGRTDMPVTFALHTTFVEPECFSVPLESCQEKDEFHIPTGKYVSLNAQEKGYVIGSQSKGLTISGYYKSSGNEALVGNFVYSVSPNFDHWILFNGKGNSNLLCIEPQCGAVNGLNIKDGCKIIKPGEKIDFWTKISKKADA